MDAIPQIQILFLVRCAHPSRGEKTIETLAETLNYLSQDEILGSAPLHWSFSTVPALEQADPKARQTIRLLRARIEQGDSLLYSGYTGVPLPVLTQEEMKKEHEFCTHNPWKSGSREVFGIQPNYFLPLFSDFLRSPGIFAEETEQQWRYLSVLPFLRGEQPFLFGLPCFRLDTQRPELFRHATKELKKIGKNLMVVTFSVPAEHVGGLKHVSDWYRDLRRKPHPPGFVRIDAIGDISCHSIPIPRQAAIAIDPFMRSHWIKAGKIRHESRSGSDAAIRKILKTIQWSDEKGIADMEIPEKKKDAPAPVLLAHMPGHAELQEGDLCVHLRGGRYCGLSRSYGEMASGKTAVSYIASMRNTHAFETQEAFSFENGNKRGLKGLLVLNARGLKKEGTLQVEYFFVDEFPSLFISVTVSYPVFEKTAFINTYAPLELPLICLGKDESVKITSLFPDGNSYSQALPCKDCDTFVSGKTFFFSAHSLSLMVSFPDIFEKTVDILPLRIRTDKGSGILSINPRGSYGPVHTGKISGIREHFTLMLAMSSEQDSLSDTVPRKIVEELEPSWISKQ